MALSSIVVAHPKARASRWDLLRLSDLDRVPIDTRRTGKMSSVAIMRSVLSPTRAVARVPTFRSAKVRLKERPNTDLSTQAFD